MKSFKQVMEKVYTSDYVLNKDGRKVHRKELVDKELDEAGNVGDSLGYLTPAERAKEIARRKAKIASNTTPANKAFVDKALKKEEVELEENHLMDYRRYTQAAKNAHAKGDHDIAKDAETKAKKASDNYTRVTGKKPTFNEELDEESTEYEKSEENKRSADAAKKQGDMFAHHLHMSDHHENLARWHASRGRHGEADKHSEKADAHHEKAMGFKEEAELEEKLNPSMGAGEYIKDFQKSDAPQFKGKSKEKKRMMGIAAYMAAKKSMEEDVDQIDELSKKTLHSYIGKRADQVITAAAQAAGHGKKFSDKEKTKLIKQGNAVDRAVEKHNEEFELGEGIFDSLKKGYTNGLKQGLKQKIKPEHHKSYNIDDVKSTSDATSILQKAKQAGHAHQVKEELKGSQHKIDKNKNGKVDAHDFKLLRKEEEELDEAEYKISTAQMGHAGKTTLKHIKNPTVTQRMAAHDVKQGVKGYRDRIDLLKAAKAQGNLKEDEMEEQAPVAPSLGVHRVSVTTSEPDHPMVSKRKETTQRFVKVTTNSKERALEQGMKHFKKKGFKVHSADHAGMVHEEVEQIEEANHREFAQAGKMHPDMAKHMKTGQEIDFYHSKTGDKISGKVTKNDGKAIHIQANKGGKVGGGETHKFAVSKNLGGQMHEGVDMPMTYKEFMEAMWPGTPEYKKKYPDTERTTGAGARHDIVDTGKGVRATRRFNDNDTAEAPKTQEKRGRGRPAGSKSGANQKVTTKSDESGGMATHSLRLPSR